MKYALSIFLGLIFTTLVGVFIAHAQDYTPLAPLPLGPGGTPLATYTLSSYLGGMLKLLIALGAGLSILVAIIGGTQYVAAGIAPSAKQDAKERIFNSFIGLTLILTSYLILNSINPGLVQFDFSLPPIGTSPMGPAPIPPGAGCPSPNDTSAACCPTGIACQACSGCTAVSGVTNKGCGAAVCFLNSSLLSKIQKINGVTGWQITESWPPTVVHISTCHQNGTCADLNNSSGRLTDPATIKTYYDAFVAAGLSVLYESSNCAPYKAVGVTNCQSYPTMTNQSSFHVR